MEINKLTEIAIEAALEAGNFLINHKGKTKEVMSEVGRDIKLELDQESEKLIRKVLSKTKINILGEELGGEIDDDLCWVIDPIDGTANYFRGLDQCCVSIALMQNGIVLIGVIYNFNTDEMYTASKGNGAFLNKKPIHVSSVSKKNKASLTTGFPASESIESSIDFLDELSGWKKIRMFGSAALSCAYVASGKCDYYAEKGIYLWDFAAGICLVQEAGGNVEYYPLDNQRYSVRFSNNLL